MPAPPDTVNAPLVEDVEAVVGNIKTPFPPLNL